VDLVLLQLIQRQLFRARADDRLLQSKVNRHWVTQGLILDGYAEVPPGRLLSPGARRFTFAARCAHRYRV